MSDAFILIAVCFIFILGAVVTANLGKIEEYITNEIKLYKREVIYRKASWVVLLAILALALFSFCAVKFITGLL